MTQPRTILQPSIEINSMDGDGALLMFNATLENFTQDVPNLYQHIKNKTQTFKGTTYFVSGSTRQSHNLDQLAMKRNNSPSFFAALDVLTKKISGETGKKIYLSKILIPDILHDLPIGTSWDSPQIDFPTSNHSNIIDGKKFILLFMQLHYFSQLFPNQEIRFNFYDDMLVILNFLKKIFKAHPEFIPPNVQIHFYQVTNTSFGILGYRNEVIKFCEIIKPKSTAQHQPLDFRYLIKVFTDFLGQTPFEKEFNIENVFAALDKNNETLSLLQSSSSKPFTSKTFKNSKKESVEFKKEITASDTEFKPMTEQKFVETETKDPAVNFHKEWIAWLQTQTADVFKEILTEGVVLYLGSGIAFNGNIPDEEQSLIRQIQLIRGNSISKKFELATRQLECQFKFSVWCPRHQISAQQQCAILHDMILQTAWPVSQGGIKISTEITLEKRDIYLPTTIFTIYNKICPLDAEKNWQIILEEIQKLSGLAAAAKPSTLESLFGGKRDITTQTFYEILRDSLPKTAPSHQKSSQFKSKSS